MNYEEQISWLKQHSTLPPDMLEQKIAILQRLQQQKNAMSKEEIIACAKKIRPVMRGIEEYVSIKPVDAEDFVVYFGYEKGVQIFRKYQKSEKKLFWAQNVPIHSQSFTYSCHEPLCQALELTEVGRITTYHQYGGHYMVLCPSTDEAIYQCPKDWLEKICAFEVISPSDMVRDIYDNELDCHVLTTVYYSGVMPETIASQPIEW